MKTCIFDNVESLKYVNHELLKCSTIVWLTIRVIRCDYYNKIESGSQINNNTLNF